MCMRTSRDGRPSCRPKRGPAASSPPSSLGPSPASFPLFERRGCHPPKPFGPCSRDHSHDNATRPSLQPVTRTFKKGMSDMYNQDEGQTHKEPASSDVAGAGSASTAPTLVSSQAAVRDDRPPEPSLGQTAGGGRQPDSDRPSGPNSPAAPAAHRRRSWKIGLMAAGATAVLAAGTIVGHVLWPASTPTMSPAGSSSPIGAGSSGGTKGGSPRGSGSSPIPTKRYPGVSGGSHGGSSQSPRGSGGSMNPSGQYPSGSSGSNGPNSQLPSGSGSSPIPTKRYPGASGGSNRGSSQQSPGGSGNSLNPNSQYPDGAEG